MEEENNKATKVIPGNPAPHYSSATIFYIGLSSIETGMGSASTLTKKLKTIRPGNKSIKTFLVSNLLILSQNTLPKQGFELFSKEFN